MIYYYILNVSKFHSQLIQLKKEHIKLFIRKI
jgi:hypothetical protein